jgi:hypothetical protein
MRSWPLLSVAAAAIALHVGAVTAADHIMPRRVMAWLSVDCFDLNTAVKCQGTEDDNTTDIMRQVVGPGTRTQYPLSRTPHRNFRTVGHVSVQCAAQLASQ